MPSAATDGKPKNNMNVKTTSLTGYRREFPDFGDLPKPIAALVAAGKLVDISWGNDACPSFIRAEDDPKVEAQGCTYGIPVLWVDYADPSEREMQDGNRFFVQVGNDITIETDDAAEALRGLDLVSSR
jgi:hypothetical protein